MTAKATTRGASLAPSPDEQLELYRRMRTIRVFEERAEELHKAGFLSGPFHSSLGQEAVAVGVCSALAPEDVTTSTHRGHGQLIAKGADVARMLAELAGRADGLSGGRGGSMHLADLSIGALGENGIVGGSMFLATGAALGFQHLGQPRVAVGFFGDGGVGQGIFHECLNLAAIWKLPAVFVCENNGYAHSFPSRDLSIGADIAAFVSGYGLPSVKVDGNDVLAVRTVAIEAVARARSGAGPSFIEAVCYRWRGHNLGDAHHLYRRREEVDAARTNDPLEIQRKRVVDLVGQDRVDEVDRDADAAFEAARALVERSPGPDHAAIFSVVPA